MTSTIVQKTESPFNLFGGGETQRQGQATGSGIVIDSNGTILTNYHVVENAVKVTVSFEKGQAVEAQVVGKDPSNDLAVLRIHPDGLTLHPLTLGNSSAAQVGDPVLAIGNPFDLERTLTTGVISALQRQITAPNGFTIDNVLQTDAPINPGNSGGPLLDASGTVIGINSQIETGGSSGGSVGIGFAVPINTAKGEIAQLEKGGTVRGAYLGLTSLTIDGSLSALNLPVKQGALVQSVQKGTPAEKAGIRGGTAARKRPDRGWRRHHRLDRRQGHRELGRPRERHRCKETGRDREHWAAASERQGGLRTQDRERDARQPPQLGAERQHSGRVRTAPLPLGHVRDTPTREDLRDHQLGGRRAGGWAGSMGGWHDLLREQPALLLDAGGAAHHSSATQEGGAVRGVRERFPGAGRADE